MASMWRKKEARVAPAVRQAQLGHGHGHGCRMLISRIAVSLGCSSSSRYIERSPHFIIRVYVPYLCEYIAIHRYICVCVTHFSSYITRI